MKLSKKYAIRIPNNITLIYSTKKKIITFIGPLNKKSIKLQTKPFFFKSENIIKISDKLIFKEVSNNEKNKIKSLQGTTVALIKQALIEVSITIYQKLKFVGVGFRAFEVENYQNKLLLLKLGYSHFLYFKIPNKITINCLRFTKLFISGNSLKEVNQTASLIRSYKIPEPYKGKGILYETEKISLKEGKKI